MHVAIVEPFYAGSHKTWVDSLCNHSTFTFTQFTLPGRHWKWRMAAGAIQLAQSINQSNKAFDVILVTDMLDVTVFKSLLSPQYQRVKLVLYMHENQFVYPHQTLDSDKNRDRHYGLINYKSILVADEVWFNSKFHKEIFYTELEQFLGVFPESSAHIKLANKCLLKSSVMPLGIDCDAIDKVKMAKPEKPAILWNHRWEYDKNPDLFFNTLMRLSEEGFDFNLNVVGERYTNSPAIFSQAKLKLANHITHWGFADSKEAYYKVLWQSNLLPITTNQEFFGLSVLEAMYCDVMPLLPNRLSYSDLYADLNVFYNTDSEFYLQLKKQLSQMEFKSFRNRASVFNWESIVKQYEQRLIKVTT